MDTRDEHKKRCDNVVPYAAVLKYDLVLTAVAENELETYRAIDEISTFNMREARAMCDKVRYGEPQLLLGAVTLETAVKGRWRLLEAGSMSKVEDRVVDNMIPKDAYLIRLPDFQGMFAHDVITFTQFQQGNVEMTE
jgi:hypothetical protein